MTREEFGSKVLVEYEAWRAKELCKTEYEIFRDAWEIAKRTEIMEFLLSGDNCINELYPFAENIIQKLCDFDFEYDKPQWTSYADLQTLVLSYTAEHN